MISTKAQQTVLRSLKTASISSPAAYLTDALHHFPSLIHVLKVLSWPISKQFLHMKIDNHGECLLVSLSVVGGWGGGQAEMS